MTGYYAAHVTWSTVPFGIFYSPAFHRNFHISVATRFPMLPVRRRLGPAMPVFRTLTAPFRRRFVAPRSLMLLLSPPVSVFSQSVGASLAFRWEIQNFFSICDSSILSLCFAVKVMNCWENMHFLFCEIV